MPTLFFVGGIFVQSPPLDQIEELARRVIESEGLELVDLEFKTGRSRSLLRLTIDKTGGVTLADCENVSHQVGTLLDVKDLIKQAYVLEVSSPGIDRPFKTDRDYEKSLGRTIKVFLPEEQIIGRLLEVTEQDIAVEENGRARRIPRNEIRRAHQEIVLGQPKKNLNKKRK